MMDQTEAARQVFEALLPSRSDLRRHGKGYANKNTQTKWRYFLLGWTLRNGNTPR